MFDIVPPVNVGATVTLFVALPEGLVVVSEILPLVEVQVTYTTGWAVPLTQPFKVSPPLEEKVIFPPLTHQFIVVLLLQLPLIILIRCTGI